MVSPFVVGGGVVEGCLGGPRGALGRLPEKKPRIIFQRRWRSFEGRCK